MSSVVISGDTSGSITLQAPAVAGATTLILPASAGTSGQALLSAGSGATMTWGSAGAINLVSTQTVSAVTSVAWTGLTSDTYMVLYENAVPATSGYSVALRFGTGATPTYITTGYVFSGSSVSTGVASTASTGVLAFAAGSGNAGTISSANFLIYTGARGITSSPGANGVMFIRNMINSQNTTITAQSFCNTSGLTYSEVISGMVPNTTVKTAIQIFGAFIDGAGGQSTGNISGTFSLYSISS